MARKELKTFTVGEITEQIRVVLEGGLPSRFVVAGELTGFKRHTSGHCYFSLKDGQAVLPCVMWKSKFGAVKFRPEDGMSVLATGYIDLYAPSGRYQFYADKLTSAGVGELQLAFEQMVARLRAEGLFEETHKKPLPRYPMRIGILTSASGAAVMDIIDSVYNRWPCARMLVYPVPVQGEGAAEKIAAAIREVNRRNERLGLDVLIVGRGGGSLEDLWAFNEEVLARAIFASRIPVISAVGHEVDVTIADLVADARASTPTRAGVIAVPDVREVLAGLAQAGKRLDVQARSAVQLRHHQLQTALASAVFRNPQAALNAPIQQVDELQLRLAEAVREKTAERKERLHRALEAVRSIEPHRLLARRRMHVEPLAGRLQGRFGNILSKKQLQITAQENRLGALDPRAVLRRGYSLTTNPRTGRVVTSIEDVGLGDRLVTELADRGRIESIAERIEPAQGAGKEPTEQHGPEEERQ